MRSQVQVIEDDSLWIKIRLFYKRIYIYAYIPSFHVIRKNKVYKNWINFAKKLIGTPYFWGGRDTIGIDCSALIQLSKSFDGTKIPRDSIDQYRYFKKSSHYSIFKLNDKVILQKGSFLYWPGHIAIVLNKKDLLHASGFKGSVVIESISKVIKRESVIPQLIIPHY